MGYRSGAPSWVYINRMKSQASNYQYQISVLQKRIQELESENEELRDRIKELEKNKSS